MKEFPAKPRIPSMYFKHLDELQVNVKNYLPPEMQISMLNTVKGKGVYGNTTNERPRRNKGKQKEVGIGPNETDARVSFIQFHFIHKFHPIFQTKSGIMFFLTFFC